MCLVFFIAGVLGVGRYPAPGPPTAGCTAAQASKEFKIWLDAVFLAVHNNPQCLVTGVADSERRYGIFHKLKCTHLQEFIATLQAYDWTPARIGRGAGCRSAGSLYTVTGNEGAMQAVPVPIGPFM